MASARLPSRIHRRSLSGVGGILLLCSIGYTAVSRNDALMIVLEISMPLFAIVVLVAFERWLHRHGYRDAQLARIAGWSAVGLVLLAVLGTWETASYLLDEVALDAVVPELLIRSATGAVVGAAVGYYDVRQLDERSRAERFRSAMEASIDGIALLDEDRRYVEMNRAHADVYGYDDPMALVGETWDRCYAEDDVERFEIDVMAVLRDRGQWRGEATGKRRDGSTFPQELSLSLLDDGGLICVVRDIGERREREQRLARNERLYRLLAENFPNGMILMVDEELRYVVAAGEALEKLGVAGEELEGMTIHEALPPETTARIEPHCRAALDGEERTFDIEYRDRNYHATIVPVADTTSDERYGLGIVQDVSERVERERELEQQTSQMEFFNSILRHDVLNGMTVVRGRAELLAESDDISESYRSHADTIVRWCDDISDIVGRVRAVLETLTGESIGDRERVDVSAVVIDELDRLRTTYPEITFETGVSPGVTALADDLLAEVLGNVLTNAIEHNDADEPHVSVTCERDEDVVTVRVADNGPGIPDADKDTIFRRGATGHAKSTGSGFGLFFVDAMISEYGGTVTVDDNEPRGAVFTIELPAASVREDDGERWVG